MKKDRLFFLHLNILLSYFFLLLLRLLSFPRLLIVCACVRVCVRACVRACVCVKLILGLWAAWHCIGIILCWPKKCSTQRQWHTCCDSCRSLVCRRSDLGLLSGPPLRGRQAHIKWYSQKDLLCNCVSFSCFSAVHLKSVRAFPSHPPGDCVVDGTLKSKSWLPPFPTLPLWMSRSHQHRRLTRLVRSRQ